VIAVYVSHCTGSTVRKNTIRPISTVSPRPMRSRACGTGECVAAAAQQNPQPRLPATTWPPVGPVGAEGPTPTPPVAVAEVPRDVLCGARIEFPRWLWTHAWNPREQFAKVGVDSDAGVAKRISAGGPSRRAE